MGFNDCLENACIKWVHSRRRGLSIDNILRGALLSDNAEHLCINATDRQAEVPVVLGLITIT